MKSMTRHKLASMIDHTALAVETSRADILRLCEDVRREGFASACLHPFWLKEMAPLFPDIRLCTVIGFPLGLTTTKLYEAQKAAEQGAVELDIVINHAWVMEEDWQSIREELNSFRHIFPELGLKLIIETCRLTDAQIITLTRLTRDAGFDWIKTSTGFAAAGATVESVRLMKQHAGEKMEVKASGGIKSLATALAMIEAGATRIGTSSGLLILNEWEVE